jgi:hypothetical protein
MPDNADDELPIRDIAPARARFAAAETRAKAIDEALRADDPRLGRTVVVQHQDGTHYTFQSAFALLLEPVEDVRVPYGGDNPGHMTMRLGLLGVFTEHNGYHVFPVDDLAMYEQYEGVPIAEA